MDPISLSISFLLEYVTPFVTKQAMFIFGAKDEVRSLHAELLFINKRLKNFDDRLMEDVMVKVWLRQIQDVAYEAKDIIETFVAKNDIQKQRSWPAKNLYGVRHAAMLHNVSVKVQSIKKNIELIDGLGQKYCNNLQVQVVERNLDKAQWLEKRRKDVEVENVGGFDGAEKQVIEMLINKRLRRDVISIVGMTGSGKTTLAKKIYGHSDIAKSFHHRAWIFVPSNYRIRNLLMDILGSLMSTGEETSKLDDAKLAEKLTKYLGGKKYLVVIDGVEKTQLWEDIEKFFPDKKRGSRIILTTRSTEVASKASPIHTHNLRPLGEDERWSLLEKLVFKDEPCPQELVNLGKHIAAKCAGLPLAIVSLASLLARKRWLEIISNVSWYLDQEDAPPCNGIFALSYDSVPEHLKLFFLYLGAFPNGFELPARRVINLWIAEELVKETGGREVEQIAERYLEELIDLSLIEVARKRLDGGVRTFRVHEFWRNFCIHESERTNFLAIQKKSGNPRGSRPRRLSLHYEASMYIYSNSLPSSNLHSLLCFCNKGSLDTDGWTLLCRQFQCLRVLDLGSTSVSKIPENIKSLPLLKYLKINSPSLNRLLCSIRRLPNLQTLDIRNTCVPCLPSGIWGLQNLRHLFFDSGDHATRLP